MADLSGYLEQIDSESAMDQSFLLYGRDMVLAHPNMSSGRFPRDSGQPLPNRDQVADLVLSKLWQTDLARGHLEMPDGKTRSFVIDVLNTSYVVMYRSLSGYGEQPLIVGRYRTIEGRFGVFDKLVYAGVAEVGVMLLALIAAFFIGRMMAAPLGHLSSAAGRVRVMDLEPPPTIEPSRLRELDDAAGAFNAMVAGVGWFETYVPRSIVRDLVKPGGATAAASSERDVTVLFTDIRRFTRLAEALPADETASFLNRHFTMLAEFIEAEEGTIDKYIGDSVMAFWGAPHPSEDHAERACRAAIAMREALARDNVARTAAGQPPVEIGIGIHCGKVIAGNIGAPGRINYTLVGDAVNTAQRLEELSKTVGRAGGPARILISVQVAPRLSGNYQAVPAGTHEIRGRYQTVDVFEIT